MPASTRPKIRVSATRTPGLALNSRSIQWAGAAIGEKQHTAKCYLICVSTALSVRELGELGAVLGSEDRQRVREAEAALCERFSRLRSRELVQLAARARNGLSAPLVKFEIVTHPLPADWVESNAALVPAALACLASIHRNGYYREAGTRFLALRTGVDDGLSLRFLLLRIDDTIESTRRLAEGAIERHLLPAAAPEFARALPIIEALRGRRRGSGGPIVRAIDDLLLASSSALRAVLTDPDPLHRLAAYRLLVRAESPCHVLSDALGDRDQRIRAWAARQATSGRTDDADKLVLLPLLAAQGSPSVRSLALRVRAKLDADDAPLLRGLVDPRTSVRYAARVLLRERHPERDFDAARRAALDVLERADASIDEVVGALGALADVGSAGDADRTRRFADHASARVRAEALRADKLLRGSG